MTTFITVLGIVASLAVITTSVLTVLTYIDRRRHGTKET